MALAAKIARRLIWRPRPPLWPADATASLKSIVATKEAKSKSYRPCDAFWLLVIIDFFDRAQDQELSDCEGLTSKGFEKIIVYKTVFGTVVEMQTR